MREFENIPDELLSGYLDDELSVAERKQVEQLLSNSERHRTTLEELRILREGLSSLPPFSLDADFYQRVLTKVTATVDQGKSNSQGSQSYRIPPVRRYFWAVASIAAALAIMLVSSEMFLRMNKQVAQQSNRDPDQRQKTPAASNADGLAADVDLPEANSDTFGIEIEEEAMQRLYVKPSFGSRSATAQEAGLDESAVPRSRRNSSQSSGRGVTELRRFAERVQSEETGDPAKKRDVTVLVQVTTNNTDLAFAKVRNHFQPVKELGEAEYLEAKSVKQDPRFKNLQDDQAMTWAIHTTQERLDAFLNLPENEQIPTPELTAELQDRLSRKAFRYSVKRQGSEDEIAKNRQEDETASQDLEEAAQADLVFGDFDKSFEIKLGIQSPISNAQGVDPTSAEVHERLDESTDAVDKPEVLRSAAKSRSITPARKRDEAASVRKSLSLGTQEAKEKDAGVRLLPKAPIADDNVPEPSLSNSVKSNVAGSQQLSILVYFTFRSEKNVTATDRSTGRPGVSAPVQKKDGSK